MASPGLAASTQPGAEAQPDRWAGRLTIGFCLVAFVLGAFEAWTARWEMNPDGIQYLDNARAYRQADFHAALNPQWSPLYPWAIAAASAIARPSREQDFPLAHAVNFAIYLLSAVSFLFLLDSLHGIAGTSLRILSYPAFLYCSIDLTNLRLVTPDLLVSCFALMAAGALVRIALGGRLVHYGSLGVALGLGFLAKTPFLPLAVVSILLAFYFGRRRGFVALVLFIALAGPYVAFLSRSAGRFTFGDSGKLNLSWHVNGLPNTNWQGGPAANGQPIHPTRQLSKDPLIFEFAAPVGGTYAPWYDPSYWNAGVRVDYQPREFARAIMSQIGLYAYLMHHRQLPLLFAVITLSLVFFDRTRMLARLKTVWPLFVLGAIPFAMYAPVHAEDRYLAPFFVLLWVAAFACTVDDSRISLAIAITAALLMLFESVTAALTKPADPQPPARIHFEIARDLRALGLKPGEQVARVSGDLPYYWAYLADARVTLQISFGESYGVREKQWAATQSILAKQPAKFLVALAADGVTNQPGWIRLDTPGITAPAVFAYPIGASGAY